MPAYLTHGPRKCQPAPLTILSAALRNAMRDLDIGVADVAKWCDVKPRTVNRWLALNTPVAIEKIMLSRRLWPVMLDQLQRANDSTFDDDTGLIIEAANA